jgi:hypothetical protein
LPTAFVQAFDFAGRLGPHHPRAEVMPETAEVTVFVNEIVFIDAEHAVACPRVRQS